MSKIGDLIIRTEEAGYDTEKMTIAEMLEVQEHGRILEVSKESELNIGILEEEFHMEEAYVKAVSNHRKDFVN